MKNTLFCSLWLATLVFLHSVAVAAEGAEESASPPLSSPIARHVVLIGVDGLGVHWIPWDEMPNLSRLRDEGVHTVARCHRPTASAINWKSVFSGFPPELHGYAKWNSQQPDIDPAPSAFGADGALPDIFAEVRRQRPDDWTVSFYSWGGVGHCHATNTVSVVRHFGGSGDVYPQRDSAVIDEGLREISTHRPTLMFLYQGQVDSRGHRSGWGSPEFTNACRNVDANIGRFVDGLREMGLWDETAIIFVADHGGLDKDHGGVEDIRVFEVPFIVSGGVSKGLRLRDPAMLMDVAPTILALLGLDVPEPMRGRSALSTEP